MAVEFGVTGYSTTGTGRISSDSEPHASGKARMVVITQRLCSDSLLVLAGDALFKSDRDVAPNLDS